MAVGLKRFLRALFSITLVSASSSFALNAQDVVEIRNSQICPVVAMQVCKNLPAARLSGSPKIDGVVDAGEWTGAKLITDLHQVVPNEYDKPSFPSEIRVGYDENYIYVAAKLFDPEPEKLVARRMVQGSRLRGEDRFRVFLSPLNNGLTGYFFETNPNGVRQEALIETPERFNFSWRSIWQVRTRITDEGWEAEFAIPFKSINFDPDKENWGLGFRRDFGRFSERAAWTSFERRTTTDTLGILTGVKGAQQGVGLDIIPNFNIQAAHDDATGRESFKIEPGLDAIYNITPTMKLSVTANTDFSTTDVDDQVVNLSRFSVFLPERRDFFLQDADIFRFGDISRNGSPFFSRRIGLDENADPIDLKLGTKLTGRAGRLSIGALGVVQEMGGVDENDERIGGDTELFVGRATYGLFDNSRIGTIFTYGDPVTGQGAKTYGFDFQWRNQDLIPNRRIVADVWWQKSDNPGDEADAGGSSAWSASIGLPSDEGFRSNFFFREIQENFDPALGFVNRSDAREFSTTLAWDNRPKTGAFRRITHSFFGRKIWRTDGRIESEFYRARPLRLQLRSSDELMIDGLHTREVLFEPFEIVDDVVIPAGDYSWETLRIIINTAEQRKLFANLNLQVGDFYTGTRTRIRLTTNWRPNKHLRFALSGTQNDVNLPEGDFRTRVISMRSDIAFNSRLSWITRVQYDDVSDSGGINSRLRYEVSPGRDIYLVVNQGFEREVYEDSPGERRTRLRTTDGDVILRVAYTFRF